MKDCCEIVANSYDDYNKCYQHKYLNEDCVDKYDCTSYQLFGICYNCQQVHEDE